MKKNRTKGFTIVELLIYMGILAIFLVVLTEIFVSTLNVQLASQAVSEAGIDGRYLIARLSYDVGRASAITIPVSAGDQTEGTLQLMIDGVTHTYTVTNGTLTVTNATGTNVLNSYATTIPKFTVTKLGLPTGKQSMQIAFTVQSTIQEQVPEIRTFQTTMGLR